MITLLKATQDYLLASKADGNAPKTISWYDDILRVMTATIGHSKPLDTITANDMRAYINSLRDRDLAEATIASYIRALHGFWNWCTREYEDIKNPMRNIKRPPKLDPKPKAISQENFLKLYEATKGDQPMQWRDRTIFCLLADTGIRLGGLVGLTVDDVDTLLRRATVTEKGKKSRSIFWTHYTNHLLTMWLKIRPLSDDDSLFVSMQEGRKATGLTLSGVQQITKRYKQRLGIKGAVNVHSFRHRFAKEFLKNGGDAITLAKLGGRQDINTLNDYYVVFDEDELAELQQKNSPLLSLMEEQFFQR